MIRAQLIGILVPWISLGVSGMVSGATADRVLYHGMTIVDPEKETRIGHSYVLVKDGKIVGTGVGKPPAKVRVDRAHDLTGFYALPGFIDAHAHITGNLPEVEAHDGAVSVTIKTDDRLTRHSARIALAFGVTTIRNPGGDTEANARYDRNIASGEWIGPEALHAGAVIQPPPFGGDSFAYPKTPEQWDAEARRQAGLGMKYFKLYVDLTEEEVAMGIRAAHAHGLKAVAHLNNVSWMRAAELGIDGLEHALPTSPGLLEPAQRAKYQTELGPDSKFMYRWFEAVDYDGALMRDLFALLARKRIVVDMTFLANVLIYNADDVRRAFPELDEQRRYYAAFPGMFDKWIETLRASNAGWTPSDYERARAIMPKVLEFGLRLYRAGVPMMIGTDGSGGGASYVRELALHTDAGIPRWAVLRMATSGSADLLGVGDRTGRIAPGFEADIVFLTADPSRDIANAGKVHGVLNDGDFFSFAELTNGPQ
jgi:hypothetical protein